MTFYYCKEHGRREGSYVTSDQLDYDTTKKSVFALCFSFVCFVCLYCAFLCFVCFYGFSAWNRLL